MDTKTNAGSTWMTRAWASDTTTDADRLALAKALAEVF